MSPRTHANVDSGEVHWERAIMPKLNLDVDEIMNLIKKNHVKVDLESLFVKSTPSGCPCQICCRPRERDISGASQPRECPEQNKRERLRNPKTTELEECSTPKRTGTGATTDSRLCEALALGVSQSKSFENMVREARDSLTLLLNNLDQFNFQERHLKIEEQRLCAEERCAAALETLAQGSLELFANNADLFSKKKM